MDIKLFQAKENLIFYSINISSSSSFAFKSSDLLASNRTSGLNSSTEFTTDLETRLSEDDPSMTNATSDIPIWDSSNIENDSINETLKSLIDNMDNITTPVFMVPDELDDSNATTLASNDNMADMITTPTTTTTSESPSNESVSMSTPLGSMNESKVIYETTTETIKVVNMDKHLNEADKSGVGGGSNDEDSELLPVENQASRVACTLEGDLVCNGLAPTCYGSGNIQCDLKSQESTTGTRKRSMINQRFTSDDQCHMVGDIICSPMVTSSLCKGSAICKADKMEEIVAYNYWQILLIAGALAIICVTIIVVGIVGYFSWTRYKIRPEANGQGNQASNKA
ncbi:uncharacterized protein LOC128392403 isoform X2 [Panonychus citri]|uniref:uncharacterized protein LOC128392403 isoform X2 n=1 Tax=Panonychus citri TaxID=50023 RepID=UPI002307D31D|nr:uncharacterized protein LOC128392403 isoform X2 [Panonychus citri]XP_053208402.1 uncharacterized protein LOC128392403 isoform X2 [Panonychus citri]